MCVYIYIQLYSSMRPEDHAELQLTSYSTSIIFPQQKIHKPGTNTIQYHPRSPLSHGGGLGPDLGLGFGLQPGAAPWVPLQRPPVQVWFWDMGSGEV